MYINLDQHGKPNWLHPIGRLDSVGVVEYYRDRWLDDMKARRAETMAKYPIRDYDPNQPRDPKGTATGGQWTHTFAEPVTSYDFTHIREKILQIGSPEIGQYPYEYMPQNDDEAIDIAIGMMKYRDELYEAFPRPDYNKDGGKADFGSTKYKAYRKLEQAAGAVEYSTAGKLLDERTFSKSAQYKIADAWVKYIASDPIKGLGFESAMYHGFDADVLDYVANNVPEDYRGLFDMFSPNYDKFEKAFVSNWTMAGRSKALYLSGQSGKDVDGNKGKNVFFHGDAKNFDGKMLSEYKPSMFTRSDNVAKNLEKMYEKTQAFYKDKLKTDDLSDKFITVQRGIGGFPKDADYSPWAAESWTIDKATPKKFGKMMSKNAQSYTVLTAKVPYSGLLMTYESMKGVFPPEGDLVGKKEFVVLGGSLRDMTRQDFDR